MTPNASDVEDDSGEMQMLTVHEG